MVKRNGRRPGVKVTVGGAGVVNHARARLLCEAADAVGLTAGLSSAMAPTEQRRRGHDRGEVLVDVAVMIADGGQTISDLAVLRSAAAVRPGGVDPHGVAWEAGADPDETPWVRWRLQRSQRSWLAKKACAK